MSAGGEGSPDAAAASGRPGARSERSLLRSGGIVGALTFGSRILGLVRDVVIASYFGARPEADAFFVAFRIPNLFRRLFAEGAFSQGFVPVLSDYRVNRSHEEVRAFVARVAGVLGAVLVLVTAAGVVGAPWLVQVFAPGFEASGTRLVLAGEMLRITFPYLMLISLAALAAGVLNGYGRFAVPAITPVWLNICLIAAAVGLAAHLVEPVFALAWGVLAAGVVQLAFQLPALARLGLLPRPRLALRDPAVRRVGRLMLPAAFGAAVGQINMLIDTLLASFLAAGAISWLYYADRLMELPLGLVAIALGTVLLPRLSRDHSSGDAVGFSRSLDGGLRLALLLAVPAAAALYALAPPLVITLFHYGAMTDVDARMATLALQAYALGLLGFTGVKILAPAYYSRSDTRTPVRFAVIALGLNLVLNLALIGPLGHVGLALATSAAALTNAGLLLRGLLRSSPWQPQRGPWWRFSGRVGLAVSVMAVMLALARGSPQLWLGLGIEERVLRLAALIGAGASAYFGLLALTGLGPRRLLSELDAA